MNLKKISLFTLSLLTLILTTQPIAHNQQLNQQLGQKLLQAIENNASKNKLEKIIKQGKAKEIVNVTDKKEYNSLNKALEKLRYYYGLKLGQTCSYSKEKKLSQTQYDAIYSKYIKIIKMLIRYSVHVNQQIKPNNNVTKYPGNYPLIQAIWPKAYEIITVLLENGANPNLQAEFGYTALGVATICNDKKIIKLLLDYNADPNIKDEHGKTPLMIISENGYLYPEKKSETARCLITQKSTIAQLLIDNGTHVNLKDNNGETALTKAAANENLEIVQILLQNNATITLDDALLMAHCMKFMKFSWATLFANSTGKNAVGRAARIGGSKALTEIASQKSKVYEISKLLLEHGANPNFMMKDDFGKKIKETALTYAALCNDIDSVKLLISYGAKISNKILISAIKGIEYDLITQLIQNLEIEKQNILKALENICHIITKNQKLIHFLIKNGANPKSRTSITIDWNKKINGNALKIFMWQKNQIIKNIHTIITNIEEKTGQKSDKKAIAEAIKNIKAKLDDIRLLLK